MHESIRGGRMKKKESIIETARVHAKHYSSALHHRSCFHFDIYTCKIAARRRYKALRCIESTSSKTKICSHRQGKKR